MPSCRTASANVGGTSSPMSNANPSCTPERAMPRHGRCAPTARPRGRRNRVIRCRPRGCGNRTRQRIERLREQAAIDDRDRHLRSFAGPSVAAAARRREREVTVRGIGEQALLQHVRQRHPELAFASFGESIVRDEHIARVEHDIDRTRFGSSGDRRLPAGVLRPSRRSRPPVLEASWLRPAIELRGGTKTSSVGAFSSLSDQISRVHRMLTAAVPGLTRRA